MLLAQLDPTSVITAGTQFGPLGWVLAVIFVVFAIGAYFFAKYVILPSMDEQKKTAEVDRESKKKLTEAVDKLCAVTGDTHRVVSQVSADTKQHSVDIRRMIALHCIKLRVYAKIASIANVDLSSEIGEMKGLLVDLSSEIGEMKGLLVGTDFTGLEYPPLSHK